MLRSPLNRLLFFLLFLIIASFITINFWKKTWRNSQSPIDFETYMRQINAEFDEIFEKTREALSLEKNFEMGKMLVKYI